MRIAEWLEIARALELRGFPDVADSVFGMQRQRVAADYLQTSAIIGANGEVVSAVNDANDYAGPGTGYRLEHVHVAQTADRLP